MHTVVDTNVLVSALLNSGGAPAKVLALALSRQITPCFDDRILREYESVLLRPKFGFCEEDVVELLGRLREIGLCVVPPPLNAAFADEADRKFYEVAKFCGAVLVTGNLKHFPKEPEVVSPIEFLKLFSCL